LDDNGGHDYIPAKEKERSEKKRDRGDRGDRDRDRGDRDYRQPRYANDFDQGRRNQAYSSSYDDRQHYSSDDGGTDTRINTSQHSLGDGDPTMGTAI
jgi:hypothetical protein